jgi:hypothetical protein
MLTTPRQRAPALVGSVLVAGALLAIGGAWAKGARTQAEISACLDANGYLYQPPGGGTCRAGTLTWNQQGPAGAQGPTGPQGQPGPVGPQGPPGSAAQVSQATKSLATAAIHIEQSASFGTTIANVQSYTSLCPLGFQAVGGGYSIASGLPPDLVVVTNQGYKLKGRSGWSVVLLRTKGFGARKVSVQANCVKTS